MKTNVRRVSVDMYRKHIESGKALPQVWRVYEFIRDNPNVTRAQIEKSLNVRISSVTGRVSELRASGLIRESLVRVTCPVTGEEAHTLKAVAPEHVNQVDMFERAAA